VTDAVTRRRFLIGAAVAAAGVVLGACRSSTRRAPAPTATTSPVLVSDRAGPSLRRLFREPQAVAAVGAFVARDPAGITRAAAEAHLRSLGLTVDDTGIATVPDPAAFADAVDLAAAADVRAGRVRDAGGWFVTETHAALARLLA
jgi:hypothetical protein